ncbi:MAG: C25 family cysteine peptidase [Candidatus Symbiothrix sp.]|jgi:hypothetical protein|nr:C25 family cysteine peptidase [Candidatus Symbiothrix sp.]
MKTQLFLSLCLIAVCNLQAQIQDRITVHNDDFKITKEQSYDRFIWSSDYKITDEGNPELPMIRVSYVLPTDAKFNGIKFLSKDKQLFQKDVLIYPAQPQIPVADTKPIAFVRPDEKIYNSDAPFPEKLYEIESDDIFHGYHIVTIRLYPFEYIPKSRILNYYPNLEYTVEYESDYNKNVLRPKRQSIVRAKLCKNFVTHIVRNSSDVEKIGSNAQTLVNGRKIVQSNAGSLRSFEPSVLDEIIPDYIIITRDSLKAAFQPLVNWKTKKGIFTTIATIEDINSNYRGSDLPEKIRNYLLEAHTNWGAGLYVLLGGNIDIVPSRKIRGVHNNLSYPSDKYFSTSTAWEIDSADLFNGNNSISYINILGRVPVNNVQEIAVYINKVIAYEKATGIGDLIYLKNNLYADAYLIYESGALTNCSHSFIKGYVANYVPSNINNKYICDNADCSGNTNRYTAGCVSGGGDIELSRENFLSCLNFGANFGIGKFHFIYHLDHSNATSISTSNKDKGEHVIRTDIDNLSNGTSYQIMLSGGCHPANFTYDCLGKHYIINQNGGVAFMGNTDIGWDSDRTQLQCFMDAIYSTTGHPSIGRYDIGSAFQNANINMQHQKWRLHLLGDPEMQVWTNTPQALTVTGLPSMIFAGTQTLNVNISGLLAGDSAQICVQKGTEIYEVFQGGNGNNPIPISCGKAGQISLTITAHNYIPVERTINANLRASTANPYIESVNFIDTGNNSSIGNSDALNDAGETILLELKVKNSGNTATNGLIATLTCNSDSIEILNGIFNYGNIATAASATGQFLYHIDKDLSEHLANSQNPITFQLEMTDASGEIWTRTFNIDVFSTELALRNKVTISQSSITLFFKLQLQNLGKAPAIGLSGTLSYNNVGYNIGFPTINYHDSQSSLSIYSIAKSLIGTTNFVLQVHNTYGKQWTFEFNLNMPDTVTGLKATSAESSILLTWDAVAGANAYNIYRCDVGANNTELGTYKKLNTMPVTFLYYKDIDSLSQLTKYYYKVTALSPSGMESEASRLLTWTSYPTKGMFPVKMDFSYDRIIADFVVADVNYDGYKEIFGALCDHDGASLGTLIALSHEGEELFDIDNNITIYSGFAYLNAPIRAGVAIGDVNNNGVNDIVSMTRFHNSMSNNKLTCHTVEDANGDHLPDILWQKPLERTSVTNPVIANIDNSPDGTMEIVLIADGNSPSSSRYKIQIYNYNGVLLRELSANANDYTYGAVAVADLDNDGDKEIIAGFQSGIYVWHHNGSSFLSSNPIYANSNYSFSSSPIICDINKDDNKDILISAYSGTSSCRIFAINTNGQLISGWGLTGQNTYNSSTNEISVQGLSKELVVGDLNHDGNLEVVASGSNCVKIWNNAGILLNTIQASGVESQLITPILADIDGDDDVEIIVTHYYGKEIYGFNYDGSNVLGFPLEVEQDFLYPSSPAIADLDKNGKSEIVAGTNGMIYVWETNGNSSRVEWGSSRHDAYNSGEYHTICEPTIISANTNWNTDKHICGNLIVDSGTLTISEYAKVTMDSPSALVIIKNGATLVLESGQLYNCSVKILPGGSVLMQQDGRIKLRYLGVVDVQGELDLEKGEILEY